MLPNPNDLRIWGVNDNMLFTHNDFLELHKLCVSIIKFNIDVICFQEININIFKLGIHKRIRNVFHQHFPTFKISFSMTPTQTSTLWKPGGTMMVTIGEISHNIKQTHNNQLGQWCTTTISGPNNQSLTIFNVCNTMNTSIAQAGPATIFSQQWNL